MIVLLVAHGVAAPSLDHNEFGWEMGWTARSIALGHGFSSPFLPRTGPTALVPPLYPYLVAGMFRMFGIYTFGAALAVLTFNSICSALTCLPIYGLLRNAQGERLGRLAAFAWAIYPLAIYFAADRVWDYALTALLFTCCLLLAQKLHQRSTLGWAAFGALYGIAALCNPSIVSVLPFLLILALAKVWRVRGAWLRKGLVASLAFVAVCTPWTVRNHQTMHANFFVRDGFWIEFYGGNNGDTSESNSPKTHPASNAAELETYISQGEMAYIAEKQKMSIDFVEHHRWFFAESCAHRIVRFWTGYWSFRQGYLKYEPMDVPNFFFCLFLLFFLCRGLFRWWRKDASAALPYLLCVLIFPLPYYLTHSSMDYRQPLEPVIIVLVTVGLFGPRGNERAPGAEEERTPKSLLQPA